MRFTCHGTSLTLNLSLCALACLVFISCGERWDDDELDTDFDIPRTHLFEDNLSSYGIYQGEMKALEPTQGVHLYEISSVLFTDYAKKQRLIKLPQGTHASVRDRRTADYPDGTIVAKTFFYPTDYRDSSQGRRVIETRLMIKEKSRWNVATYIWNDAQTDATLNLDDVVTPVSWIDDKGEMRSTNYEIPGEVACVTCHQNSDSVALLGLTPRNLNREVTRDGTSSNQLTFLHEQGVFGQLDPTQIDTIIDYKDTSRSKAQRARAYLDVNCSHCHHPGAWEKAARQDLDLRYETSLEQSGLTEDVDQVEQLLSEGEMPYVGTTVLHDEGVALLLDYLSSL